MPYLSLVGLALVSVSVSACATTSPAVQASTDVAVFDRYRTFSVSVPDGAQASAHATELQRGLAPMITGALESKGYVAMGHGDLLITVGSGERNFTVKKLETVGTDPDGERALQNADAVENSIAIDAFDAATHARVWHGADHVSRYGAGADARQLQVAVNRLLASFPTSALQRALEPSARRQAALESPR